MDSRGNSQYFVGVGRRKLLWLALGALIAGTPAAPAAATDTIEFDVEQTQIDAHDAQLLLNLNTDNIENASVTESWNSLYKREPGTVSGRFAADTAAGTFSGQFVEMWSCSDCRTDDGQEVWATDQTIMINATVGGNLIPDGAAWRIDGSVDIAYEVDIKAEENPSDCGGEPCWICKNRVCEVGEQMSAQAPLEGWIQDDTLALWFSDRLLEDADQMDFSEIRRTQFIMSRFALQITGTVPLPAEEAPETGKPDGDPLSGAADAATEAVQEPPEEAAAENNGAPTEPEPDPIGDDPDPSDDGSSSSDESATAGPANPDDDGFKGLFEQFGIYLAMLLLLCILLGGGAWWYKNSRIPPAPPPSVAAEVTQFKRTPDEMGAGPAYILQSTGERSYVEGNRGSRVITYQSGTVVDVVGRAGNAVKVQVGNDPPIWIDNKNLKYLRR